MKTKEKKKREQLTPDTPIAKVNDILNEQQDTAQDEIRNLNNRILIKDSRIDVLEEALSDIELRVAKLYSLAYDDLGRTEKAYLDAILKAIDSTKQVRINLFNAKKHKDETPEQFYDRLNAQIEAIKAGMGR